MSRTLEVAYTSTPMDSCMSIRDNGAHQSCSRQQCSTWLNKCSHKYSLAPTSTFKGARSSSHHKTLNQSSKPRHHVCSCVCIRPRLHPKMENGSERERPEAHGYVCPMSVIQKRRSIGQGLSGHLVPSERISSGRIHARD